MNEGCQQRIEHPESRQSHANTVHCQGSAKILYDDAMAATGNLDGIHQAQKLVADQHDFCASRATSVPDPIAIPTVACISAGASLIPSPTMATFLPLFTSCLMTSLF